MSYRYIEQGYIKQIDKKTEREKEEMKKRQSDKYNGGRPLLIIICHPY